MKNGMKTGCIFLMGCLAACGVSEDLNQPGDTVVKLPSGAAQFYPRQGCDDDAREPNDSFEKAVELRLGETTDLNICGNSDWYWIDLRAGQIFTAEIGFRHADGDLDLELLSASGERLFSSASILDQEQARFNADEAQRVYLHVFGFDYAEADYSLRVELLEQDTGHTCLEDTHEPNDSQDQATVLIGEPAQLYGTACPDNPDWYKILPTWSDTISFEVEYEGEAGDLSLALVEPDQYWLSAIAQADNGIVKLQGRYHVRQAEEHHFVVTGNKKAQPYRLTVSVCPNDLFEPNDIVEDSTWNLTENSIYKTIVCPGDEDWFAFELGLGHKLAVSLISPESDFEVDFFGPVEPEILRSADENQYGDRGYDMRSRIPGVHAVRIRGGQRPGQSYLMFRTTDPYEVYDRQSPICGDIYEGTRILSGVGDRRIVIEVQECSSWMSSMYLHARLIQPQGVSYQLKIYDRDWNLQDVGYTRTASGFRYQLANASHGGGMGTNNQTYYLTIRLEDHDGQEYLPNQWTLELRGGEDGW